MPVWGWEARAVDEGRESLEGKRDFSTKENEISIESEMLGM
jgi:hypothetical protein